MTKVSILKLVMFGMYVPFDPGLSLPCRPGMKLPSRAWIESVWDFKATIYFWTWDVPIFVWGILEFLSVTRNEKALNHGTKHISKSFVSPWQLPFPWTRTGELRLEVCSLLSLSEVSATNRRVSGCQASSGTLCLGLKKALVNFWSLSSMILVVWDLVL